MSEQANKFKTKRGNVSLYALLCGYVQQYMPDGYKVGKWCTLEQDCVYRIELEGEGVRNVIGGNTIRDVYGQVRYSVAVESLTEARRKYALAKREVKRRGRGLPDATARA